MIYAVIDTNVIVSALITKNSEAATIHVIKAVLNGQVVPVYNKADTDPFGINHGLSGFSRIFLFGHKV